MRQACQVLLATCVHVTACFVIMLVFLFRVFVYLSVYVQVLGHSRSFKKFTMVNYTLLQKHDSPFYILQIQNFEFSILVPLTAMKQASL